MDKKNRKLSPLELMNQLKAGGKSSKHLPQRKSPPSELNLDFSDLVTPVESVSTADAVAAAHAASATALAEPSADGPAPVDVFEGHHLVADESSGAGETVAGEAFASRPSDDSSSSLSDPATRN